MRTLFSFLIFGFVLLSCKKGDAVAACVQSKIDEFKSMAACNAGAAVKEYRFEGKLVYVFEPGDCIDDGTSEVIDSECTRLGALGGFIGNTKINGVNFYDHADFKRVIWSN